MPQELRVVCCFQCRKFQSDIVKKARKWTCKLCGANQSLVKEYARGSGRECRLLVQQLSESSQRADQIERDVAEQVLAGKIEMPVVENAIREESERLVASHNHGAGRATEDSGSKWDGFRLKEDDDEPEDLMKEKVHNSSWENWGKSGKNDHVEVQQNVGFENPVTFKPRNVYKQPSSSSKLITLADFHQMNKQDKKQFKWQTKVEPESKFKRFSTPVQESTTDTSNEPLLNFQPKLSLSSKKQTSADLKIFEPTETTEHSVDTTISKRKSSDNEPLGSQMPMMSFAKKSKWSGFNRPEAEKVISSVPLSIEESSRDNQMPPSASKWSKFVPPVNQEEEEIP